MGALELKNSLVQRILSLENMDLLQFLDEILPKNNEVYELNEFEQKMIEKGLEDIAHGRVVSNEEVMKELDKWLGE